MKRNDYKLRTKITNLPLIRLCLVFPGILASVYIRDSSEIAFRRFKTYNLRKTTLTDSEFLVSNEKHLHQNTQIEWMAIRPRLPQPASLRSFENKMAEVERSWTDEQLQSEEVSKKDIIKFLHEHASFEVLEMNLWCFLGVFFIISTCIWQRVFVFFSENNDQLEHFKKKRFLGFWKSWSRLISF